MRGAKIRATRWCRVTVVYSASVDHIDALLKNLLLSLSGFGLVAVGATGMVASSVAKVALRPMRDAATAIGEIDEKSLDRRIEVKKLPSELAPVGQKLNDMLARLETAFAQRKQFLADASHELRTPVAAIVTTLEVALRRGRDIEGYVGVLHSCLSDARLLHQLVVALLDQVRSERFATDIDLMPVSVSDASCGSRRKWPARWARPKISRSIVSIRIIWCCSATRSSCVRSSPT